MNICVLGRQPAIGYAELESLYGADAIRCVQPNIAGVDDAIDFARLGSVVKSATHLTTVASTNTQKVFDYARRALPEFIADFPDGKIKLGVSLYGLTMPLQKQNALALSLKKTLRDTGRSVRVVPNTEPALTSAQTYHNQLTSELGCELLFVRDGDSTLIGRVTHVQNINEYTERDRDRPKRDARVGMLPPKLAQVIINLAVATHRPSPGFQILDPFCGTGVILQESLLMGYSAHGSDISQKMVDYTGINIMDWLPAKYPQVWDLSRGVSLGDATTTQWEDSQAIKDRVGEIIDAAFIPMKIDAVACEGYLGTPFASEPPEATLKDSIMTCNLIMKKFLRNIHGQLAAGTRLCIAAPAWFVRGRVSHLPCLSTLDELGYTRITFEHADNRELIYHRDDQIVGRELLVLTSL